MRYHLTGLRLAALVVLLSVAGNAAVADNWLRNDEPGAPGRFRAAHHRTFHQDDPFADDPRAKSMPEEVTPEPDGDYYEPYSSGDSVVESDGGYGPGMEEFEEFSEMFLPFALQARGISFFGGAEYLQVRPTFSQPTAFVQSEGFGGDTTETLVNYDFEHGSSVRAFIGFQLYNCNSEVRFTYTNFDSEAEQLSGVTPGDSDPFYVGTNEVVTQPGQRIQANAAVQMNAYDLEFSKTLCLGESLCGGGGCCARWDVTWSFGVRMANVLWNDSASVLDEDDDLQAQGKNRYKFTGAGPRVGIFGRRHFGYTGRWSLYGRANFSLLLGQYEAESVQWQPGDVDVKRMAVTRVIPVTDIEFGASWRVMRRVRFSSGYLFQVWHDLGMTSEFGGNLPPYDDANIMGFDGYFVRGEFVW